MSHVLSVSLAAALLAASLAAPAAAQAPKPVALVEVNVRAVALGYRATHLIGRSVTNEKGESIGRIDDLIVGQDKVLFVIISVGGFLGIGGRLISMPYNHLAVTKDDIVLRGASKESVGKLPPFQYTR